MSTIPTPTSVPEALDLIDDALTYVAVPQPGQRPAHRFPLEAYAEAYKMLQAGSGPRGKVILDVSAP